MRFTGKLGNRRGAGSIIGATFLILILLTGYTFYTVHVNVADDYTETLEDMQQLDLKRYKENIEFISVSTISGDRLNVTVRNTGSYQTRLIWLGVFDETVSPYSQRYYKINYYVSPAETVTDIRNESITIQEGAERVIQIVTELGNTFSYSYPSSEDTADGVDQRYDFVDETYDSPATNGMHSFFPAQKAGPDGICDTLAEGTGGATNTTMINQESFEGAEPSGWSFSGRWEVEGDEAHHGDWSADFDGQGNGQSGTLETPNLDCSDADAIYVSFYFKENVDVDDEFRLLFRGDSWNTIENLGTGYSQGSWHHWELKVTESQYFRSNFRIRWGADDVEGGESAYVDFVTVKKEVSNPNYKLNLEVRFTGVDYNQENEWLCIYGGDTMGSEDVLVDVWYDNDWNTVFTDLSSGWNSVNVSSYLVSSPFRIRFRGGLETGDANQDSWDIDATFLYVWTEES